MELCVDNHQEICYEGRLCPLCDIREDLKGEISDLEKKISEMELLAQEG